MTRVWSSMCGVLGAAVWAVAATPGPLDGQNIPTDFAVAELAGVQTNWTGYGDVTDLEAIASYTSGSELDAIYLAVDADYLYVALAGNLVEDGTDFVILIDSAFDDGQTELRTEGVGGPPFLLQLAGRDVIVNTNGTPEDGSDDSYAVPAGSGTMLPTCGDPSFTGWDYALAVDGAGGVLYGHEYLLFPVAIDTASADDICNFADGRGRVSCDPTPENASDPALPVHALRNFVFESPIGDGNEVFEGGEPQFGFSRGGFVNSNTGGVTDTDAVMANATTSGIEVAIPLASIGDVYDTDVLNILVMTIDGDEYGESMVSNRFGNFLNQTLPSLATGSGYCDPAATLGPRPDLSNLSCLTVDLGTLSGPATDAVLDGDIVASDYSGGAPMAVQTCPTSGGDQIQLDDQLLPVEYGSEQDAIYTANDDAYLYLGVTGNLEIGGHAYNVFIDTDADGITGDHVLDFQPGQSIYTYTQINDFGDFAFEGTYESWLDATIAPGPDSVRITGTNFGGGYYNIDPNISVPDAYALQLEVTVHEGNQANQLAVVITDEDITERLFLFTDITPGHHVLTMPLADYAYDLSPGATPGLNLSDITYFHITGGMNDPAPGVPFDVTYHDMAFLGILPGAAPVLLMNGAELPNGPLNILDNGRFTPNTPVGYDVAYSVALDRDPYLAKVSYFDLANDVFTFRGAVDVNSADSLLFDPLGGLVAENPNGMLLAFDNTNTTGVSACGYGDACFDADSATVAADALAASSGMEMAIPLADLGFTAADLPRIVNLWTVATDPYGRASNQSLGAMRNATAGGNQIVNPGRSPVNFTDPNASAGADVELVDFTSFSFDETNGVWNNAITTSGPDGFRVQDTDFGGGLHDIVPDIDAAGAARMNVEVTLNPANVTDRLVVTLEDADGTRRVYHFDDLTNGEHSLTIQLADYYTDDEPGTTPGLDLGNISILHLGGGFHNGIPGQAFDMTFHAIRLIGEPRNFEARAIRVCLGTVQGDADCDGDNDLVDFALLQQCVGIEADPVLPMECERLNFVKDGTVDAADIAVFTTLLDGE